MDIKIKKAWVKNLRSREYRKGKGFLAIKSASEDTSDSFCCLGVLCDMAVQAGVIEPPVETKTWRHDEGWITVYEYDGMIGELPQAVMEWAGLEEGLPDVAVKDYYVSLADLNDGVDGMVKAKSHRKIADLIEASL